MVISLPFTKFVSKYELYSVAIVELIWRSNCLRITFETILFQVFAKSFQKQHLNNDRKLANEKKIDKHFEWGC